MRFHSILDPRLRVAIPEHWPSTCTIQTVNTTVSASNEPVPSGATDVSTLKNIPCRIGPRIEVSVSDNEQRSDRVLEQFNRRQAKLNGYFPQIVPRLMQAVVDGVVYGIRGVEHDSERFSTRLNLENVEPHG